MAKQKYTLPDNDLTNGEGCWKLQSCHLKDSHLSEFLDDNTIAGLNHVFRGKSKLRRLIWSIIFIFSIIGCIALISLSIKRFSEKPTASTITVVSRDETGVVFPSVTICNVNLERNFSDTLRDRTYLIMNYLYNPDESFHLSGFNTSYVLQSCDEIVPSSTSKVRSATIWNIQRPSKTIEELIHFCGFVNGAGSDVIPCKNDFKPVLTSAGICFTYNGSKNVIHSTGIRYGLKLVLNIHQEKRPSFNGKSGVKIVVHDRKDIARPNLYGIAVPPGYAIDIGVHREITRDETSEAECIDGMDLPFFPSDKYDYSQFACRENAVAENTAKSSKCGCIIEPDRPSSSYATTRNCTFGDACCLLREHYTFNPETVDCPLPCYFPYYEHTASYSSFPNGGYLDTLVETLNTSVEDIKENFLSINVFVDDLQVTTTTTQYTYGPEALLGEIGGQLGLFIGVSIITFFEVLILCGDELKRLFCTRAMRKKLEEVEEKIALPEIESGPDTVIEDDIEETAAPTETESVKKQKVEEKASTGSTGTSPEKVEKNENKTKRNETEDEDEV